MSKRIGGIAFMTPSGGQSKGMALAEVTSLFILFLLWIKYLETTWVGVVQLHLVGWDFFAHLMMAAFPLAVIGLARRPLTDLGFDPNCLFSPQVKRLSLIGAVELALIWTAVLLIPHLLQGQKPALLMPPDHFALELGWPPLASDLIGWGLTIIFTVIFCGVGEEVLFRGYIQGRLNRAWGRPFQVFGVHFGWGLILASVFFGVGHGIAFFNPFDRPLSFHPDYSSALVTSAEGLILGFLYEHTNGIAAPAAVHAAIGFFFGSLSFPG